MRVAIAEHLGEVVDHFKHGKPLQPAMVTSSPDPTWADQPDLADVRGQSQARRALEVAAAGGHNLLMLGPPGAGKTMLARRFPTLLPPLSPEESLEVTAIHSVAGLLGADRGLLTARPFRAPHHTVSVAGLVGGGDPLRPGEVSLAHRGCLFLDELLEFRRSVLEALRQPLEDGEVTLARARARAVFPARPMLVAAVNPCPCGYEGDRTNRCKCTPERVRTYKARLSGPLLDRIDIQVQLPPVDVASLYGDRRGEPSSAVRERVVRARSVQQARRGAGEVNASTNAALSSRDLERVARPDHEGAKLLAGAVEHHGLSARAYGKVLRVARTFADLDGSTAVNRSHVSAAIGMRLVDYVGPLAQPIGIAATA
jgi:magnesium chelatase family protein